MKNKKGLLILLISAVAISWGVYECKYYYARWSDYRNSPWAYSRDQNAKLLVGTWEGKFTDPDKIDKTIRLEIFVPRTDEERKAKAGRRWKRASYSSRNKNTFHGLATVNSRLGTEVYDITGAVEKDDIHRLHFSLGAADEQKRVLPHFALLQATEGEWNDDYLTLTFSFGYKRPDGSSFYSSADPRHAVKARVKLSRTNQD
jgi:hypothetical protein